MEHKFDIAEEARGPYDDTGMFSPDVDEAAFRAYAQKSPPPDRESTYVMHPWCRDEWHKLGQFLWHEK